MNPWLYSIPILYFILMIVIGVVSSRQENSRSEFYVASNKMGGAVLFATIFATVVGANTFMGFSGMVYSSGFSMVWMLTGAGTAYFVLYFISSKIRKIASEHQVFTLPDYMELRYSKSVALFATVFSMIGLIGGAGGGILGVGIIIHSILGLNTTLAIIITAIVTILYTTLGGLKAVALTDWLQSIIMVFGVILVIFFGFTSITDHVSLSAVSDGIAQLKDQLDPNFMSLTHGMTIIMFIAYAITFMPLNTISQTQIQRVYAAKSTSLIRRISLLMVLFVALFMAFGLALVGVIGKDVLPDLSNPETVFPMLAIEVINPVVGMIIVTGIIGACMSTVDSNLLGASMHISRDIYERYAGEKSISDEQAVKVTKWTLVIIGILSTVAAIVTPSILDLLLVTMHIFAGAAFAPIIAGLYWKKANTPGALVSMILGGGSTLIAEIINSSIDPVIIGIIFSVVSLIIVSLLTSKFNTSQLSLKGEPGLKKDTPFLIGVIILFIAFFVALNTVNLWPVVIWITLLALVLSLFFLIWYFVKDFKEERS